MKDEIVGKGLQIAAQSGRIVELKQQAETLGKDLATTQVALGEQTRQQVEAEERLTKLQEEISVLQESSTEDKAKLATLEEAQVVSKEELAELDVFRESWIAPFAAWNGTLGSLLGLLLVGGPGASLITSRLLGGKLVAGKDELVTGVSQAINSLKETEATIETRVVELTNQQFEKTIQKVEETKALQEGASRQLEEISNASAGQLSGVSETVSASVGSLKELLTGTEQKILAGQTTIVTSVEQSQSQCQQHANELKLAVESKHAAQVTCLREGTASISSQLQEEAKLATDRFEATRTTIETGRADVGIVRDALRQEINDTSEATIRRIAEKSDSQLAPLNQLVQETRDDLGSQADLTQAWADQTRDTVNRIGQQVDQLPMRLETAGGQISTAVTQEMRQQLTNVQITVQSVRDQIDQVKHQFESGLHESERRQIENSGRTEQLSKELARLASLSDHIVLSIQSETATVASEVKDVTHGLSGSLTRVESQVQSVIRELDQLRNSRSDSPALVGELKGQLQQLQQAIGSLTGEPRSRISRPAFELESVPDVESTLRTDAVSDLPQDSPAESFAQSESKLEVNQNAESISGTRRQEIKELSMLPGLGEKSAETLVTEGVNSIHELADLAEDRKGVIEQRGGQFRRLDEWVAVARKVRRLHEEYDVPLKAAVGYAQAETWPEKLRHLAPEDLQRLSSEFRGFAIWLNESSDPETDLPSESDGE